MADEKIIASVRQKLVNSSKTLKLENELLMRRYAFERLLSRVSASAYRNELCLKGAMAFLAVTGDFKRPTRDMDFTAQSTMTSDEALKMWREIAAISPEVDDGLTFVENSFRVEEIQSTMDEPGARILGEARLGNSRIPLKIEVSYGHKLTPGAVLMDYPTILDGFDAPSILCYSKETILAEKFEAACALGERNSRFKDFYDIRGLARTVDLEGPTLAEAFRNTFGQRGTDLPSELPASFAISFQATGQKGWLAFQRKQGYRDEQTFSDLIAEISPLVMGASAMATGADDQMTWEHGKGWAEGLTDDSELRTIRPF